MMKVHRREKYSVTKYRYGTTKYMPGVPETPADHCRIKLFKIFCVFLVLLSSGKNGHPITDHQGLRGELEV
jgi:hypothetical protein